MDLNDDEKTVKVGPNIGKQTMLYVDGSTDSFKCECGCNVFTQIDAANKYRCNSCRATYIGGV